MTLYKVQYMALVEALVEANNIDEAKIKFDEGECISESTISDNSKDAVIYNLSAEVIH
jgi:hypothetical protein